LSLKLKTKLTIIAIQFAKKMFCKEGEAFYYWNLYNWFFLFFPIPLYRFVEDVYSGYLKFGKPKKGEVVIDGGAYEGNFTIIASRLIGKNGKIIAIEPDPQGVRLLKNRLKKLNIKNVTIVSKGLWSRKTKKSAFSNSNCPGELSLFYGNKKEKKITLIKLDSLVKKLKLRSVDFVKMDIEGSEIEALIGAAQTLKKFHPRLAIASYHIIDSQPTSKRVEKILKTFGYKHILSANKRHLATYAW